MHRIFFVRNCIDNKENKLEKLTEEGEREKETNYDDVQCALASMHLNSLLTLMHFNSDLVFVCQSPLKDRIFKTSKEVLFFHNYFKSDIDI